MKINFRLSQYRIFRMIISHTHKFIFICNGKTGTTSIEKSLSRYQEGSLFEIEAPDLFQGRHIPPSILREMLGHEIWDSYFKFCFIRNTWDWFVSQLFHNCKGYLHEKYKPGKREFVKNPFSYFAKDKIYREKVNSLWQTQKISVEQIKLTYTLLKKHRGTYSAPTIYQKNYVYDQKGNQLIDFVGRFENLSKDFDTLLSKIGLIDKITLPVLNKNLHKDFRDYYTPETISLVGDLFRPDIEAFDFSFSDNQD